MQDAKCTISVNDHQLTFYKLGQGAPLLCLHGGRVRARTFRRVIERLAQDYTVIAPDIPGYGDSETPHALWSFADYAAFFDTFLQEQNLSDVTVVGYSMGGGIAFNLAAQSTRVAHLVLIDAAGLPLNNAIQNHHDLRRLRFYLTHLRYISTLQTLWMDFLRFIWKHRWSWRHMKAIRRQCFTTSYQDVLTDIRVPTDIVWGRDDWVFPIEIAEHFQESIPHSHLWIVPGNHDWLLYDPLQFDIDNLGVAKKLTA